MARTIAILIAALFFVFGPAALIAQQLSGGGGSGGTPGGSNTQLQYNNSGAFGGTSGLTWSAANTQLIAPTGCTNPAYSFNGILTTGVCVSGGNNVSFAINSNEIIRAGVDNVLVTQKTSIAGSLTVGTNTFPTVDTGELAFTKITDSASAPGANYLKLTVVCGTNAGTAKIIARAGTSTTAVTVVDNIGTGVTGC